MNKQNLAEQIQVLDILPVASVIANGDGDAIDLYGLDGDLIVVLDALNADGTDPTLAVKIQESDTDVAEDFTDAAGAAFTVVTDAEPSVQKLNLSKDSLKRYIRAAKTIGGTDTPAFLVSVKGYALKKYQ